jgi:hypothetical protein
MIAWESKSKIASSLVASPKEIIVLSRAERKARWRWCSWESR